MNLWTRHNKIHLLESGEPYFKAIISAIDHAQTEILIEAYIFENDRAGRPVIEALKRAAARGVEIHLVVDAVGSKNLSPQTIESLQQHGIQVYRFRPLNLILSLGRVLFQRLHRKIIVVDQEVAFVGGINIVETQYEYLDYAVEVRGPLVLRIHKFTKLFLLKLLNRWVEYFQTRRRRLKGLHQPAGDTRASLVVRDSLRHRFRLEGLYLHAIENAKQSICIANAYFLPGYRFRRALMRASERGVEVKLLLQGTTDTPLIKYASSLLYRELLESNIRIFEYQPATLHAKVAVIDQHWATVGSCNLDIFSLFLSLEANILVDDEIFAAQLKTHLNEAILKGAKEIDLKSLEKSSIINWIRGIMGLLLYRLIRFLSGSSSYRIYPQD